MLNRVTFSIVLRFLMIVTLRTLGVKRFVTRNELFRLQIEMKFVQEAVHDRDE